MRTLRNSYLVLSLVFVSLLAFGQQPELQNFRLPGKAGVNVFEAPKDNKPFDGLKVRVGGDFALQFQGLRNTNDFANATDSLGKTMQLTELGTNVNLPTANLNIDVQLLDGVRLHMRTYLSSRHHTEAWIKGGYLMIDNLNFIKKDFLAGFMNIARFKFGMDEYNYGDTHFRRTDNARAIYNPFVGNYIMDAFATEPYGELNILTNGFIGVLGVTNGRLNQSVLPGDNGATIYGKVGYDKQINDDLRIRLTGSFYNSSKNSTREYLYGGDRSGSRYYNVMDVVGATANPFSGRFNPGFKTMSAFQINPFVKFHGLEFFGVFEMANNKGLDATNKKLGGAYTQLGAELLYRFANDHLYVGGRYNSVTGQATDVASTMAINRMQVGGGWFISDNILTKVEYMTQSYSGDAYKGTAFQGGQFNGFMIEAVIGF
ncbi:hypothetical protein GC194_10185 [bacterium]|nr:hypothetical protein [bacterium]